MKSFIAALRNLVLPWGRTSGQRIVLDGDHGEIDIYDALNRLVVMLASASPAGLTVGAATDRQVQVVSSGTSGRVAFSTNSPKANTAATIVEVVFNEGAANESISWQFIGPSVDGATDHLELLIDSQNADGSSDANLILRVAGAEQLLTVDRSNGFNLLERVTVTPPASANSALLVAADGAHTGALMLATIGGVERARISAQGRLLLTPVASANSILFVEGAAGQTGALARWRVNSVDQFVVDPDGTISTYAGNAWNTYVPAVGGGGTATFSVQSGWWQRTGKRIDVGIYLVVNAAGSGAANVTVDLPTTPYRGTRQTLPMHTESVGPNGSHVGNGAAVVFTGGASVTVDRLRTSSNDGTNRDSNITGADLLAAGVIDIQGWYREA